MPIVAGQSVEALSVSFRLPDTIPEGVLVPDLPFDIYRGASYINASGLKTFKRSPAHYWWERFRQPKADTPAFRFGRLLHMAVLEPERLRDNMQMRPAFNLRTKDGRESLDQWRTDLGPDGIEVSDAESEQLIGILKATQAHPRLAKLLDKGKRETSVFWTDPETELRCKARYDFVAENTNVIVDLKTCQDARPSPFERDSVRFDYGLSAVHYLSGAKVTGVANHDTFAIVAVEKEPPYGIQLYSFSRMEMERCEQHYRDVMRRYAECVASDNWPAYPDGFEELRCPAWAPWVIPPKT